MPSLIEALGQSLAQVPTFQVQYQAAVMIVTLPVGQARTQTVKVSTLQARHGAGIVVRLQSRACVARQAATVSGALRANGNLEWGGLALDTSTNPPVLDVVYHLIGEDLDMDDFLKALQHVANYADSIERTTSGGDQF